MSEVLGSVQADTLADTAAPSPALAPACLALEVAAPSRPAWWLACERALLADGRVPLHAEALSHLAERHHICLVLDLGDLKAQARPGAHAGPAEVWYLTDGEGAPLDAQRPLVRDQQLAQGLRLCVWRARLDTAACAAGAPSFTLLQSLHAAPTRGALAAQRPQEASAQVGQAVARLLIQAWLSRQAPVGQGDSAPQQLAGKAPQAPLTAWQGAQAACKAWARQQRTRWLSEHWRVGLVKSPIQAWLSPSFAPHVQWLTPARGRRYHADPVGLPGSQQQVFAEQFDERTGRGHLVQMQLGPQGQVLSTSPVAVGQGRHVSFPQLLHEGGRTYGLLESSAGRVTTLYEVGAQGQWRPLQNLLEGIAAVDPTLFRWQGRYWLAYTDADLGEHDNLCLQHADTLLGPWRPHAHNPVKVDVRGARMAGPCFEHEGVLYRPAQDCLRTYGAAVVLQRVLHCSPDRFEEAEVRRIEPAAQGECPDGMHTLSAWGEHTLIDGKHMRWNLWALLRKLQGRLRLLDEEGTHAAKAHELRHVAVVVPHLRMGGGELSMLRVAQGLVRLGLRVSLIVNTLRTAEVPVPEGVDVHDLGCEGTLSAANAMVDALRVLRPQVVFSAFPHTNVSTVWAARTADVGVRCVVSEHAPLSLQIVREGGWRYRVLPPLVRWAYRRADAVVAVSQGVADDLQGMLGPRTHIRVVHNPVIDDRERLDPHAPPEHPWLADRALQVVISVSRLSVEKDIPTLMRAFAQLHARRPDTRLLVLGEGPDRARLEALRAELGLNEVVQMPGRVNQPRRWVQHAVAFGLASHYEGFGNVLIEALSCGVPVVSTDCPVGPRDILAAGRFGQLVPVGDWQAMALALQRAIEQGPVPADALAHAAGFTESRSSQAYLALFESLM